MTNEEELQALEEYDPPQNLAEALHLIKRLARKVRALEKALADSAAQVDRVGDISQPDPLAILVKALVRCERNPGPGYSTNTFLKERIAKLLNDREARP
jgi:hypothetical protein